MNIILKIVIIRLCFWIGEDTESEQKSLITNGVFYAQFFNTGILIILVNANLKDQWFVGHHIKKLFNGLHTDYTPDWYIDVGLVILQTMVIQVFMPIVNTVKGFVVPIIKQKIDSHFTDDPYKTRSTSLAKYRAIYGGEEYLIHFKYSDALVIVYVACLYGIGIPLLFPIAAIALANTWLNERIQTAYQVVQPPAMDDTMTNNAMGLLKVAPIILLVNGYWMLSNRQIFANYWHYIEVDQEPMRSGHILKMEYFVNWASPILVMVIASFAILVMQYVFAPFL